MIIFFVTLYIFVGYFFYLLLAPIKTLKIKSATVITKEINPGDLFVYKVDYCRYTNKGAIIYRTFHEINERNTITFPSVQTVTIVGCAATKIPLQTYKDSEVMPAGEYYMLVDVVFQINVLRTEHVVFRTDNFKIK